MKSLKMIIAAICFIYQVIFPQIKSEDVKEAILSNGLKVLILEVHAYPLVSVNMTYHAGSVDDITQGDIDVYLQYIPLSSDGAVVAA